MLPVRRSGTCGHCAPLRRRLCKSSTTEVVSSALDALRQLSVRLGNVKILVDHNALEILTKVRAAHVRMRRASRCVRIASTSRAFMRLGSGGWFALGFLSALTQLLLTSSSSLVLRGVLSAIAPITRCARYKHRRCDLNAQTHKRPSHKTDSVTTRAR